MPKEFVSELEKIMPAEELDFEPTIGFGRWAKFFPKEAVAHPAKANLNLINFLIEKFTKPGSIVLDPMAGTYSTCVLAALSGRIGIGVDIEDKFYQWGLKAKEIVEKTSTLTAKGEIIVLKGDARKLSELLSKIQPSTIITSPPYLRSAESGAGVNMQREGDVRIGCSTVGRMVTHPDAIDNTREYGSIDAVITSPPYLTDNVKKDSEEFWRRVHELGKRWSSKPPAGTEKKQMTSPDNIANLPLGSVDTIITSPPYSDAISRQGGPVDVKGVGISTITAREYSSSSENIGNLPHGKIDTIITSPPYTNAAAENPNVVKLQEKGWIKGGDMTKFLPSNLSEDNIGRLPLGNIDTIITSPPFAHESTASKPTKLELEGKFRMGHSREVPYTDEDYREWNKHVEGNIGKRKLFIRVPCSPEEAQFHDTRPERKGTIWEWTKEVEATPEVIEKIQKLKNEKKGRSETYLEAMLKVYSECLKVLKPNGLMIVVVKPFQRNFKVVDLPHHTYILLSRCGFILEKLYKLRLKQQSFWRILIYKKHPELPRIMHEWILVCRKP
jgi:DNA modification methylase